MYAIRSYYEVLDESRAGPKASPQLVTNACRPSLRGKEVALSRVHDGHAFAAIAKTQEIVEGANGFPSPGGGGNRPVSSYNFV